MYNKFKSYLRGALPYLTQKNNTVDTMFLTTNTATQLLYLDQPWFYDTTMTYSWYTSLRMNFKDAASGNFVRCPSNIALSSEHSNPNNLSRDNLIGMLILMAMVGDKAALKTELLKIVKRGFFFQNTHTTKGERKILPDLCGPYVFSILLRAWGVKNNILDFFLLLNIIVDHIRTKLDSTYNSTVYHTLSAFCLIDKMGHTVTSKLALRLFLERPSAVGYPEAEGLVSGLKEYSRSWYDPPIYLISEQVITKLKKNIYS